MNIPFPTSGPIMKRAPDPWSEYLHLGMRRTFQEGAVLLRPGELIDHLWLLHSGEILVSHSVTPDSLNGLFLMRENAMLGLLGFFAPTPTFATWVAVKPVVAFLFSRECIYNQVPNILLLDLLEQFAILSRSLSRRFVLNAGKTGETRLAQLVLHLLASAATKSLNERGRAVTFAPGITQAMAGYMLNMHAVTFNRLLVVLRAQGILGRFTKHRLEILDLPALQKLAGASCSPGAVE